MNILCLTGNLGRDAEVRLAGSSTVCGFSVAMTSGYGDKKQTVWISCSIWGKQAEGQLPSYLKKGQQVAVSGELSTREYEGKTYLELRVGTIDLIGKRDDGAAQGQHQQATAQHSAPAVHSNPSVDSFDVDVPF